MKLVKIRKNLSAFSDLGGDYMSLEMPKDILSYGNPNDSKNSNHGILLNSYDLNKEAHSMENMHCGQRLKVT